MISILILLGLRWQRWAIYQRLQTSDKFQYSIEDYIYQNMIEELNTRSQSLQTSNQLLESTLYSTIEKGFTSSSSDEVRSVMQAYYSAFNRKNFEEIRYLWLPDENVELLLPGFEKVV